MYRYVSDQTLRIWGGGADLCLCCLHTIQLLFTPRLNKPRLYGLDGMANGRPISNSNTFTMVCPPVRGDIP